MRLLFVARKLAFRSPGFAAFSLPAGLCANIKYFGPVAGGLWLVAAAMACGRGQGLWLWPWLVAVARACGRGHGLWPWPGPVAMGYGHGFWPWRWLVASAKALAVGLGFLHPWPFGFWLVALGP